MNSNITLTAEFDAEEPPVTQYTVTVVGGTGGGQFEEGSSCTVVAAAAPSGQVFYGWVANGQSRKHFLQLHFHRFRKHYAYGNL